MMRTLFPVRWLAALVIGCTACAPALSATLSPAQQQAALQAIIAAFEEQYVFPEMRPQIVTRLQSAQREGRYATGDPLLFAERITDDLRAVSRDKHVSLVVDPAGYAAAKADDDSDDSEQALWRRQALRDHHGLAELKVLGGNVRYLKITGFEWVEDETGRAYDDAMRFLKGGDAVIIDVRGNGGGTHAAVRYLVSHFMRGDTLEMSFLAGTAVPEQSRTLEYLPAGRLQNLPLYVLIDGGTASAAEAFAYDVQQFKLGELVGARTVGAANNNKHVPIAPGFILSVSYGRPLHAVSNSNWEGIGVAPTVDAPPQQALAVAHSLALKRLRGMKGVTAENLNDYSWAATAVEASLHPVALAPDRLQSFAGRYSNAQVDVRDGFLWLSRPDRPTLRLSPMTADGLFAVDGIDRLRVRFTGQTLELLRAGEAAPRVFPRG